MKTDSLFFQIFQTAPEILFELVGEPAQIGENYDFRSEEVKQTAFRIDGVFVPKPESSEQTIIFTEVQFQNDPYLYDRMFAEIGMYLVRNKGVRNWRAIAIFERRSYEPEDKYRHRDFLQGEQFQVIFLEDFLGERSELLGIQLMQLIVSKPKDSDRYLQEIVKQVQDKSESENKEMLELINTVIVYKFPQLTRQEIEAMFSVSDLKQTKVYQEALEEGLGQGLEQGLEQGRAEGEQNLVLRLLERRFGAISPEISVRIRALPLEQVESLGEALLNFSDRAALDQWLKQNL